MQSVATVLVSGGIDSAACAHFLNKQGNLIRGVFVDYGQAAVARERSAAMKLAKLLDIEFTIYRITGHGTFSAGELPGRNAFLIVTALFLSSCRRGLLALGIHAGTAYFDCSPAFVELMARLVAEHTDGGVSLVAPFLHWSKRDVFDYFVSTGLPLDATYSCEAGTEPVCGRCLSCRDRRALGC
jgi:7-cyano-7-deazaguanine synthase